MSGHILTSPRPHSANLRITNVGRYSYLSSAPFGKPTHHKCREIFLPLLGPIRQAYASQMSGDILASPRPHSANLHITNVGRYSCLSSAPFGKPTHHKCREIFLPLLGPIRQTHASQMSGDILASPRPHSANLRITNVGRYSCLSSVPP